MNPTASNNYNEILFQISTNLTNALNTFGPSSSQYQTILETLKSCLRNMDVAIEIDGDRDAQQQDRDMQDECKSGDIDPDMLSLAMGFLKIGEVA